MSAVIFGLAVSLAEARLALEGVHEDEDSAVDALEEVNYRAVGKGAEYGSDTDADELAEEQKARDHGNGEAGDVVGDLHLVNGIGEALGHLLDDQLVRCERQTAAEEQGNTGTAEQHSDEVDYHSRDDASGQKRHESHRAVKHEAVDYRHGEREQIARLHSTDDQHRGDEHDDLRDVLRRAKGVKRQELRYIRVRHVGGRHDIRHTEAAVRLHSRSECQKYPGEEIGHGGVDLDFFHIILQEKGISTYLIQKHVKMPNFIIVGAPLYHSFAKRSSLICKKCVFGDHLSFFFAFCSLMMKGS